MRNLRKPNKFDIIRIVSKVNERDLNSLLKLISNIQIDIDTDCWFRSEDWSEYSRLSIESELVTAHRLSYKLFIGPLIDGREVCHYCDIKGCFNYEHLFQGTHSQNIRDKGKIIPIRIQRANKQFERIQAELNDHRPEIRTREIIRKPEENIDDFIQMVKEATKG